MSHISPENEQFIQHELELGEYRNREELLDRAVGLLKRRRELQTDIQSGIDSGVSVPAQEVFARLEKRAQELGGGAQGIFRRRLGDLLPTRR